MSVKYIPLTSPFSRIQHSIQIVWLLCPLNQWVLESYNGLPEIAENMLSAEIEAFSSNAYANLRNSLASKPYLKDFSTMYGGRNQVPIMLLAGMLATTVFSSKQLRKEFEFVVADGTKMPKFIYQKYLAIREFAYNETEVIPTYSLSQAQIIRYGLEKNLLNQEFLEENKDAQELAFSILLGTQYAAQYELDLISFTKVTYKTGLAFVNSIAMMKSALGWQLVVAPFSDIKIQNKCFDPTLIQGMLAFIFGSHFQDIDGNNLDFSKTNPTGFLISMSKYNFFSSIISFYLELPKGLLNPGYTQPQGKNTPVTPQPEGMPDLAMLAITSERNRLQPLYFANNLFSVNRNWFYIFVRANKLFNLSLRKQKDNNTQHV